jgi:hypothetical protein
MAFPLMAIGLGLKIGGSLFGANSAIGAGQDQYIESKRAAVMARIAARQKAEDIRGEGEAFAGQQKVSYAKSGVLFDTGSPLLAIMDTVVSAEENALRAEGQGAEQARALSFQGKSQLAAAKGAAFQAGISGVGSALTFLGKQKADAFKVSD